MTSKHQPKLSDPCHHLTIKNVTTTNLLNSDSFKAGVGSIIAIHWPISSFQSSAAFFLTRSHKLPRSPYSQPPFTFYFLNPDHIPIPNSKNKSQCKNMTQHYPLPSFLHSKPFIVTKSNPALPCQISLKNHIKFAPSTPSKRILSPSHPFQHPKRRSAEESVIRTRKSGFGMAMP